MTAADGQGNVISLIQSLFSSFGAGIVAGETGITLHNRGSGFNLIAGPSQSDRPAQAAAAHARAGDDAEETAGPGSSFGVMGGDNQAQAHAQVVMNLVDFGMNIQNAGEAARMRHGGGELFVESGIGDERPRRRSRRAVTPSATAAARWAASRAS